ncbi:MAG: tripartite tricarboxylate transporter permease, partial [Clostridia bacterium]|nr:tripartite tricarboxylate transporter permease [Clostridia bacterium]
MMDLLGAAVQALQQIFTFQSMAHMLIGVSLGTIIGIIPGLGGNFCLAILIPFIFSMNPVAGIAFLEGAHAATATGSAVTSILINTPGASFSAATCLDGYPMTKKGEAGRALSAAAVASGVGGIIGAACLLLALPAVRPLVMAFSPPEFFALTLFGIAMIAFVGEGSFGKSLISGLLGLLISFIGNDPSTGINRFSFGTTYLFDGIDLIPVVIGLFAFSEMLTLIKERRGIVQAEIVARATAAGILQGILDNLRHWWLLLRCSVLGTFLGFIPGIGGEVAGFIAYGHAVQSSKNPEEFGQGRVEGVIAPESANNSKEGGALIPTLAFGIPGSSGMAILLGAFLILGLEPGPSMLKENLPMTLVIVWTLAFANLFAALICLGLANPLARIAR